MKDRLGWLGALLLLGWLSAVHDPRVSAGVLAGVLLFAGRDAPALLRRAVPAVALFGGAVSAAYAVTALRQGHDPLPWLSAVMLRMLTMVTATLLAARRFDLVRAAAPLPVLQTVLVLALTQVAVLRRAVGDFRMALRSRSPGRPSLPDAARHGGAVAAVLIRKAERDTAAVTQAMISRGFLDDADPS